MTTDDKDEDEGDSHRAATDDRRPTTCRSNQWQRRTPNYQLTINFGLLAALPIGQPTSHQIGRLASGQAGKQAGRQAGRQARKQTSKQASQQAKNRPQVGSQPSNSARISKSKLLDASLLGVLYEPSSSQRGCWHRVLVSCWPKI